MGDREGRSDCLIFSLTSWAAESGREKQNRVIPPIRWNEQITDLLGICHFENGWIPVPVITKHKNEVQVRVGPVTFHPMTQTKHTLRETQKETTSVGWADQTIGLQAWCMLLC